MKKTKSDLISATLLVDELKQLKTDKRLSDAEVRWIDILIRVIEHSRKEILNLESQKEMEEWKKKKGVINESVKI